jgi:hypothetical protein
MIEIKLVCKDQNITSVCYNIDDSDLFIIVLIDIIDRRLAED